MPMAGALYKTPFEFYYWRCIGNNKNNNNNNNNNKSRSNKAKQEGSPTKARAWENKSMGI